MLIELVWAQSETFFTFINAVEPKATFNTMYCIKFGFYDIWWHMKYCKTT